MPAKDQVAAEQFTRRITIQKPPVPGSSDDGQGGQSGNWTDVYVCWANIQDFPLGRGAYSAFFAQQRYPTMTTVITIRYQPVYHIDAGMRIKFTRGALTHFYKILGVKDPKEANVSILMFCQEDQAKGIN